MLLYSVLGESNDSGTSKVDSEASTLLAVKAWIRN